jgi:hypothetical protein
MIRSRILGYGLAVVLGVTVIPCLLTPAYAETIDLLCTMDSNNVLNLSIDMTARSVSVWRTDWPRSKAEVWPATITTDDVTWVEEWANANPLTRRSVTLDRNTGVLHYSWRADDHKWSYTCTKKGPAVF